MKQLLANLILIFAGLVAGFIYTSCVVVTFSERILQERYGFDGIQTAIMCVLAALIWITPLLYGAVFAIQWALENRNKPDD